MRNLLTRLWKDESGQGMVEYGLILALVAVLAVGALRLLGDRVEQTFTEVQSGLNVGSGTGGN